MPGEINIYTCDCNPAPGTTPPDVANYVVSIEGLFGIVELNGTGVLDISTSGNTINFGLAAGAGLGTVTSVAASSSNSNLVVAGSPITTFGTLAFSLAGALNSISGLVTAADKMIYTTASDTYAVTDLSAFARTLLDDAAAVNARSTLGLVIGTNVQAFSQDLSDFVTFVSWSGDDMTSTGGMTFGDAVNISGALTATGLISGAAGGSFSGDVSAGTFTGNGAALTNLDAGDISAGTLAVARGGTGLASYTTGQVLYASAATTIAGLTAGAAGTFLRFAGAGVAPVVSTLILPNAGTTGDVFIATATNTMGRVTGVATGNVFLSGGVGVIPAWGKVTSSHVDSTIATLTAGSNSNITTLAATALSISGEVTFPNVIILSGTVQDSLGSGGSAGNLLQSDGTTVRWSSQITIDTLTINTSLSTEATTTAGGTTGDQTINKLSGSVNFAGGASSLIVTNSLCTASTYIFCTVMTNDTTALIKNVVATSGSFTIRLNAAATAETKVAFLLVQPS